MEITTSMFDNMSSTGASLFGTPISSIVSLALLVLMCAAMWKLFEKAGIEGWKALIPFYNIYLLYELTWGNGLYALLLFVPVVDVIVTIITAIKMAKAFGKGTGFGVGLFFFPMICQPILAFGDAKYQGVPA